MLVLSISGCSGKISNALQEEGLMITLEEAIGIGNKELERRGDSLSENDLKITADNEEMAWEEVDSFFPIILQEKIRKLHNDGRKYWVVSYIPKKPMLGGIAIIFIDRTNGKILDFYGGE